MPPNLRLATVSNEPSRITVVLADDHLAARRNLELLLGREPDVEVVAEAADLSAVVRQVVGAKPDVLVADLELPHGASVEAIRRLRAQVPETEVVVLTMDSDPSFAKRAFDAGAIGYVLKDRADTDLPLAVRSAACGEEYVSPQLVGGVDALRQAVRGDLLSPRETEILRLIALGHTSAEIAAKLHLSRRTVESHRARIFRKLGLSTRAELVAYALGRKLIG